MLILVGILNALFMLGLTADVAALRKEVKHMSQELEALKASIAELKSDVDALITAWNNVKGVAATAADLNELKAAIDAEDVLVEAALNPPTP